ncbi:MAG: hypothetical protein ACREQD_09715, partial [Candidatus Binataceae bacterium]
GTAVASAGVVSGVEAAAVVVAEGATAAGAASAHTACIDTVIAPSRINRDSLVINANPPNVRSR